jgi:hypothetical protein
MTNSQRLLLHTLPRWSGVSLSPVLGLGERLEEMWVRGEAAGHHAAAAFDPVGIASLRANLLKDFSGAPKTANFEAGGAIDTVLDLNNAMLSFVQKPLSHAALLTLVMSAKGHEKLVAGNKTAAKLKKEK